MTGGEQSCLADGHPLRITTFSSVSGRSSAVFCFISSKRCGVNGDSVKELISSDSASVPVEVGALESASATGICAPCFLGCHHVACCCVCCACMSCFQQGTDSQEQRRQWITSIPLERALFNPKIPYNHGELALLIYVHVTTGVCSRYIWVMDWVSLQFNLIILAPVTGVCSRYIWVMDWVSLQFKWWWWGRMGRYDGAGWEGVVCEEGSRVVVGNEEEENREEGGGGDGSSLKVWRPLTQMCLLSWPQLFLVVDCSSFWQF